MRCQPHNRARGQHCRTSSRSSTSCRASSRNSPTSSTSPGASAAGREPSHLQCREEPTKEAGKGSRAQHHRSWRPKQGQVARNGHQGQATRPLCSLRKMSKAFAMTPSLLACFCCFSRISSVELSRAPHVILYIQDSGTHKNSIIGEYPHLISLLDGGKRVIPPQNTHTHLSHTPQASLGVSSTVARNSWMNVSREVEKSSLTCSGWKD